MPSLSESTQELLKRVGANKNFDTSGPEWEKAREQVLKRMASSNTTDFPPVLPKREGENGSATPGAQYTSGDASSTQPDRVRGRPGRPRGSRARGPRGNTRGGTTKRKRDRDDSELSDAGSDVSASYTPAATVTKSGRNISKPQQFNPAPEMSPTAGPRRRRINKRGSEFTLCAKCLRGHSPASNMVVFCDGCNEAYHQWCHSPMIPREVVDVAEKEWFCSQCQSARELEETPLDQRVAGNDLTDEEKAAYFTNLSHTTLAKLLSNAVKQHPALNVFAPNTRELLQARSQTPDDVEASPDDPYPDYSNDGNDPPATYPRPGSGPIALQPTTDPTQIQWLADDNFDVYSHSFDDGTGMKPIDRSKGDDWIQHSGRQLSVSSSRFPSQNGLRNRSAASQLDGSAPGTTDYQHLGGVDNNGDYSMFDPVP